MSWINEHRGTAQPAKAGSGAPLIQAGLALLLFAGAFGAVWFWRGGTVPSVASAGRTMPAVAAPRVVEPEKPVSLQQMLTAPKDAKTPQDVFANARKATEQRLDAAVRPPKAGERIGARGLATFLGSCRRSFEMAEMMLGAMPGDTRRKVPDTPQAYEARFVMLESQLRSGAIFSAGAMQDTTGRLKAHESTINGGAADHVGDFIACALTRSSPALCDANNRAAALTFLSGYFDAYTKAEAGLTKLDAQKRLQLEKVIKPHRHRQIERELEKHAQAGVLMAGDVGWIGNARVKEILGRHKAVGDGCAGAGRNI